MPRQKKVVDEKITSERDAEQYTKIIESISRLDSGAKAMQMSGLSREAVLVLIKHKTGIPMKDINAVLETALQLKKWCLAAKKSLS